MPLLVSGPLVRGHLISPLGHLVLRSTVLDYLAKLKSSSSINFTENRDIL